MEEKRSEPPSAELLSITPRAPVLLPSSAVSTNNTSQLDGHVASLVTDSSAPTHEEYPALTTEESPAATDHAVSLSLEECEDECVTS